MPYSDSKEKKLLIDRRVLSIKTYDDATIYYKEPSKFDVFYHLDLSKKLNQDELTDVVIDWVQKSFVSIEPTTSMYNPDYTLSGDETEDDLIQLQIHQQFFKAILNTALQPIAATALSNISWQMGDKNLKLSYNIIAKIAPNWNLEECAALAGLGEWLKLINQMFNFSINGSEFHNLSAIEQQFGELPGCIYQQLIQVVTDFLRRYGYHQRIF